MKRPLLYSLILTLALASLSLAPMQTAEFPCESVTEVSLSECRALVALYNATGGPSWKNRTNWLQTLTPSNWYGVTVEYGVYVSTLDLRVNNLTGSIPSELSGLSRLDYLYLYGNQLSGEIPPELGSLSLLTHLYLNSNKLTGTIPPELGNIPNLWWLDLSNNNLSGSIPPELSKLKVYQFDLSGNQLSGSIPPELGNLPMVGELQLWGNALSGSIPPELGKLSTLRRLDLSWNQLSGAIPASLGELSNLWGLYLYQNQLSGTLPAELGKLQKLEYLDLASNQLTGPFPAELGNLAALTHFDIYRNPINTTIPLWLGNLTNLRSLNMNNSGFYGHVPPQIANLQKLESLILGYNWLVVPAQEPAASFLAAKDPDWYKTQAFDQYVQYGTSATVRAHDGSTIIHISPKSLPLDSTFSFIPQIEPTEETGALVFAGNSFHLNAVDKAGGTVTEFAEPLLVELYYDETKLGETPEEALAIYYWNLDKAQWLDIATTCGKGGYTRDLEANKLSVSLCHLSEFSLMNAPQYRVYLPMLP